MGLKNKYRARMLGTAALAIMAAFVSPPASADPDAPGAAIAFEIEPIALGDALQSVTVALGEVTAVVRHDRLMEALRAARDSSHSANTPTTIDTMTVSRLSVPPATGTLRCVKWWEM